MPRRRVVLPGDGWSPPPVPKDVEFVARVRALVQEADDGARDQAGLRRRMLPGTVEEILRVGGRPGGRKRTPARGNRSEGHCVGCGGGLDAETAGCRNCRYRHLMRLHYKLRRLCSMIERAFP